MHNSAIGLCTKIAKNNAAAIDLDGQYAISV